MIHSPATIDRHSIAIIALHPHSTLQARHRGEVMGVHPNRESLSLAQLLHLSYSLFYLSLGFLFLFISTSCVCRHNKRRNFLAGLNNPHPRCAVGGHG